MKEEIGVGGISRARSERSPSPEEAEEQVTDACHALCAMERVCCVMLFGVCSACRVRHFADKS